MDSQYRRLVTLTANKGVWLADPLSGVNTPEGYASSMENFLFYNNGGVSRKGLQKVAISDSADFRWLKVFPGGSSPPSLAVPEALYVAQALLVMESKYFSPAYNPQTNVLTLGSAFTGAAFTTAGLLDNSLAHCNLELIVGGNKQTGATGLHRIVGTSYTQVVGENWYFVQAHKSRLVVGYENGVGDGFYKLGWTVPGTNNDFTSFGAGDVTLTDSLDTITGVLNLQDFPVIARGGGFTIANPTSQANPAYDLKNFTKSSQVGPIWPENLADDGNTCYFVGDDNVYSFDLARITPIGDPILKPLMDNLLATTRYRGVVTRADSFTRRRFYVLSPLVADPGLPFFIYDILAQTWQTWYFDESTLGGMTTWLENSSTHLRNSYMPCFVNQSKEFCAMTNYDECEKTPKIAFGPIQVNQVKNDYRVLNNNLAVVVEGAGGSVTLLVEATQGLLNSDVSQTLQEVAVPQLANAAPQRLVFKVDLVGNFFKFTFTFPVGNLIRFDRFEIEFAEAGELR